MLHGLLQLLATLGPTNGETSKLLSEHTFQSRPTEPNELQLQALFTKVFRTPDSYVADTLRAYQGTGGDQLLQCFGALGNFSLDAK